MSALLFAIAMLPVASDPAPPAPKPLAAPTRQCQNASLSIAKAEAKVAPRRLADEPQAHTYLGVQYVQDGCDLPIKVSDRRAR